MVVVVPDVTLPDVELLPLLDLTLLSPLPVVAAGRVFIALPLPLSADRTLPEEVATELPLPEVALVVEE